MAVIEVESLTKMFRIPRVRRDTLREHVFDLFRPRASEELRVLNGISFELRQGETLGIMGRNGCGKSTLLKLIAGIYRPDTGSVRVNAGLTAILELGLGWNGELDAIDNIFLVGSAMGLSLKQLRASIDDILAFAELERFANLKVRHYSSGMAARLAYAVAFKAVREILILDEIFAVGDASFKSRCENRYRELIAAGHTVIMVSHTPDVIASYCNRAMLIEGGTVRAEGPADYVARQYTELMANTSAPELADPRRGDG